MHSQRQCDGDPSEGTEPERWIPSHGAIVWSAGSSAECHRSLISGCAGRKASTVMSTWVRGSSRFAVRIAVLTVAVAGLGAGAAAAQAAPVAPAGPALVAALPSQCSQSGPTETCTFTTRGETQFTVPRNVSSIQATVAGGHGGTRPPRGA